MRKRRMKNRGIGKILTASGYVQGGIGSEGFSQVPHLVQPLTLFQSTNKLDKLVERFGREWQFCTMY